jgi:hypothetical protein
VGDGVGTGVGVGVGLGVGGGAGSSVRIATRSGSIEGTSTLITFAREGPPHAANSNNGTRRTRERSTINRVHAAAW